MCADEIIARLPEGYDTQVGEGGSSLSTGEKQLLSFARALLADPRIFVLDEATSSVDTITEQKLQQAIANRHAGKNVVHCCAQAFYYPEADVILVVQDGRIIEQGLAPRAHGAKKAHITRSIPGSTASRRCRRFGAAENRHKKKREPPGSLFFQIQSAALNRKPRFF